MNAVCKSEVELPPAFVRAALLRSWIERAADAPVSVALSLDVRQRLGDAPLGSTVRESRGAGRVHVCSLREMAAEPEARRGDLCVVLNFEDDDPYLARMKTYACADLAIGFDSRTVERLRLLHPIALRARDIPHAVEMGAAFAAARSGGPILLPQEPAPAWPRGGTVLLVVDHFLTGGLENVVVELSRYLKSSGIDTFLGSTGRVSESGRAQLLDAGLELVALPESARDRTRLLERRGVALVNAHYSIALAKTCAACDIPFVQTVQNAYLWLSEDEKRAWREAEAHTDAYLCVSAGVASFADQNMRLSPSLMAVVPNPSRNDALPIGTRRDRQGLLHELRLPEDAIVFANVGTVTRVKGQLALVDALARLSPRCPEACLVLVGNLEDADYVARVRARVHELSLDDKVRLLGHRRDLHRFYDLARALVMPSFTEGWSLTISEAVRRGVPVIATDVGGAAEQLTAGGGALIPAPLEKMAGLTVDEYSQALEDPARRAGLAEAFADAMEQMARTLEPSPRELRRGYQCQDREELLAHHLDLFRRVRAGRSIDEVRLCCQAPQRQHDHIAWR